MSTIGNFVQYQHPIALSVAPAVKSTLVNNFLYCSNDRNMVADGSVRDVSSAIPFYFFPRHPNPGNLVLDGDMVNIMENTATGTCYMKSGHRTLIQGITSGPDIEHGYTGHVQNIWQVKKLTNKNVKPLQYGDWFSLQTANTDTHHPPPPSAFIKYIPSGNDVGLWYTTTASKAAAFFVLPRPVSGGPHPAQPRDIDTCTVCPNTTCDTQTVPGSKNTYPLCLIGSPTDYHYLPASIAKTKAGQAVCHCPGPVKPQPPHPSNGPTPSRGPGVVPTTTGLFYAIIGLVVLIVILLVTYQFV